MRAKLLAVQKLVSKVKSPEQQEHVGIYLQKSQHKLTNFLK